MQPGKKNGVDVHPGEKAAAVFRVLLLNYFLLTYCSINSQNSFRVIKSDHGATCHYGNCANQSGQFFRF